MQADDRELLQELVAARQHLETAERRLRATSSHFPDHATADLVACARSLYAERRAREGVLPTALLGEPGWDLLLHLYVAYHEDRPVTTSAACAAAAVPTTTALRWLDKLEEAKLITRTRPAKDSRIVLVGLSQSGVRLLTTILERDCGRQSATG